MVGRHAAGQTDCIILQAAVILRSVRSTMPSVINRPFFSVDVLIIAGLVILAAIFLSQWLAIGLSRLLF
jgi:hypothetical protein